MGGSYSMFVRNGEREIFAVAGSRAQVFHGVAGHCAGCAVLLDLGL
jgi:hypothetical protein